MMVIVNHAPVKVFAVEMKPADHAFNLMEYLERRV
jgi:hypothetical protein